MPDLPALGSVPGAVLDADTADMPDLTALGSVPGVVLGMDTMDDDADELGGFGTLGNEIEF